VRGRAVGNIDDCINAAEDTGDRKEIRQDEHSLAEVEIDKRTAKTLSSFGPVGGASAHGVIIRRSH